MPRSTFRRSLARTIAGAAVALLTNSAAWAATDIAGSTASATAPIEILGNPLATANQDPTPRTISQSVAFKNLSSATATAIDFTWLFIDANGSLIGEQRTSTRGRFAPSADGRRNVSAAAATHFPGFTSGDALYVGDEDTNAFEPVDHVVVQIDNASFADGSAWHGKTRMPNALPPILSHDRSADAAHIRITKIQTTRAGNSVYDRVDTLFSFANDSAKQIDTIAFTETFYDRDGTVIVQQPAYVRGAYPTGAKATLNPATRIRQKGVVMNGGSVWLGWGERAQYVAKIAVGVDSIRYSDGTIWEPNS